MHPHGQVAQRLAPDKIGVVIGLGGEFLPHLLPGRGQVRLQLLLLCLGVCECGGIGKHIIDISLGVRPCLSGRDQHFNKVLPLHPQLRLFPVHQPFRRTQQILRAGGDAPIDHVEFRHIAGPQGYPGGCEVQGRQETLLEAFEALLLDRQGQAAKA